MSVVYLDHNSTTPLDERVLEKMLPYLRGQYGNPSSFHRAGRVARTAIDCARVQIAVLINAEPEQIIFTSGGAEANNLALLGALAGCKSGRLSISAIEHATVRSPGQALASQGWQLDSIAVDGQGRIQPAAMRKALNFRTRLISVMWANNETGVIQDIGNISSIVREGGAIFHTDAVQAVGKIKVDFKAGRVQLMSLSAHKMNGPKGIGALVVDETVTLQPLLHGGGQEHGLRAGTENVAAIVGFGAAAELAVEELDRRQAQWLELRSCLEMGLLDLPGCVIFADQAERLPNTVLVSVPGFAGETLLTNLERAGFLLSSGSACASGSLSPSPVLIAMGVETRLLRNVLRISLGAATNRTEVDLFLATLQRLLRQFAPWDIKAR